MTPRRVPALAAALAAALLTLTACAAPPTTTYTDEHGAEVTVDWVDYPGSAGVVAEEVLQAPLEADVEGTGAALMASIQSRLDAEFALDWSTTGEPGWFPTEGNGFGGPSTYISYNSQERFTDTVPGTVAEWERVVQIVSEETAVYGLGVVVLDHERSDFSPDDEWQRERYGTDDPREYWSWSGWAYGASQWLSLHLADVERDPSGRAAEDHERHGWQPRTISLSYGATVVPDAERASFTERLEPFTGLKVPDATSSD